MAIYHLSVKIISRNKGRSVVAAAAYRAGEKLINEYDGVLHDYTRKNWVEYSEIILPDNAPKEYVDRNKLWNAVELGEKSKDARLAREFEIALPKELSKEEQIELLHQFVNEKLVSKGVVVDVAIHNPPIMNDRHQPIDAKGNVTKDLLKMQFINPHAHILTTLRTIDENGKWEYKSEKEYVCKRGNEEKGFTANELFDAKEKGWEKQFCYVDGKKKVWLSSEEGKALGLKRTNNNPKTTRYGRLNPKLEYLNSKDRVFEWREYWNRIVNQRFKELCLEIRIDHRSYKARGLDEIPTIHMGKSATNMEKRAERELREGKDKTYIIHSDIFTINKQIKEHNKFVREIKEKLDAMVTKAKDALETVACKLETIRANIIGNQYEEIVLTHQYTQMSTKIGLEASRMEKYESELSRIEIANKNSAEAIRRLQRELQALSIHQFAKKADLRKQIQREQEKIEDRREYQSNIPRMCGFVSDDDYEIEKKVYTRSYDDYRKLGESIDAVKQNVQNSLVEYRRVLDKIESENIQKVDEKRASYRRETEATVKTRLQKTYKSEFSEKLYEKTRNKVDNILEKDSVHREHQTIRMKTNGKNRQRIV